MTLPPPSDHFQGKTVVEHLREARTRGALASSEIHGTEMSGHIAAAADAAKETSMVLLISWVVLSQFSLPKGQTLLILLLFSFGYLVWKIGRSALLGWARVERLHRLIEEERWEIEHHRHQEKEELTELYQAKGFSGKLLVEVVDVLMADDNRLLKVMLEEELGLTLEAYEHPLKQSLGAGLGVLATAAISLAAFHFFPPFGIPAVCGIALIAAASAAAKLEKNRALHAAIWNLAVAFLSSVAVYFLIQLVVKK